MGTISALWDSGVLGAMATMVVTTLGQLSALNNQKFAAVLEILQALPQQRLLQQLATALPQQQPLRAATRLYVSQQ